MVEVLRLEDGMGPREKAAYIWDGEREWCLLVDEGEISISGSGWLFVRGTLIEESNRGKLVELPGEVVGHGRRIWIRRPLKRGHLSLVP